MATDCITQVTFQGDGFAKPVVARFDQPQASTDGGLVLLKALDRHLGLTERLAACLDDAREPGKVQHEIIELVQQRIFGLCAGYADCNDAARLGHDPIHKLMVGRDPLTGLGLASQPTLSRFENAVSARELRAMTHALADLVIAQQRRRLHGRATRITIDLDPTDDPTHGQQEFAFFNGHYDTWCYLPLVATVTFNDEPVQFAVAAVLRSGKAPAGVGARGILRALLRKLRAAFPTARFRVRLDGGFASAKLFTCLEREQVEYVVAMPSNRRLEKRARRLLGRARVLSRQTGETAQVYGETWYGATTWMHRRRVIIKAEVVRHPGRSPKNNARFVVTNLTGPRGRSTRSTASGATWRTGSRNCITAWRWTAPAVRSSGPISSGSCSRWPRTFSFRSCAGGRRRRPTPRSPRCGSA
jgi:Transposase DDE domain group 1